MMKNNMKVNLADAFKTEDVLAYLYPAGDDFENLVPGTTESTVSGRTMTIPGNKKLVFQNACSAEVLDLLNQMNVDIERDNIIPLSVDPRLPGKRREVATIREVEKVYNKYLINPKTVIGGQVFKNMNPDISAISPERLYTLNSKEYMKERIDNKYLPQEFACVDSKKLQKLAYKDFPNKFWMKLNASSSGDGVRYITSKAEFETTKKERKDKKMFIIIQEDIEASENVCINFMISPEGETKVIGYSEQATNKQGEFFGSKITNNCERVDRDMLVLIEDIMSFLRYGFVGDADNEKRYGVGAIDVLRDKETGKIKVIDPNLRFNASTNFLVDKINGNVGDKNILMFNARFDGTMQNFETNIIPLVEQKLLRVLAMSKFDDNPDLSEFSLQVGALYNQEEEIDELLEKTKYSGVQAGIYNLINKQGQK